VLRHLFTAGEVTSAVLLTMHNLTYFLSLLRGAREAIMAGRYTRFRGAVEAARGTVPGR
jgi:queuine tRNA-ribosyltransferase